jgi:isopenicillin N synthase-like dioxygenase
MKAPHILFLEFRVLDTIAAYLQLNEDDFFRAEARKTTGCRVCEKVLGFL